MFNTIFNCLNTKIKNNNTDYNRTKKCVSLSIANKLYFVFESLKIVKGFIFKNLHFKFHRIQKQKF